MRSQTRFDNYMKRQYELCDILISTANLEIKVYGRILSGSVADHVNDCNYCKYVRFGDHAYLYKHWSEKSKLELEWTNGKRSTT